MKFPVQKIVEVDWKDACGQAGWDDIEEHRSLEPMPCKSVGYLLKKNKTEIVLAFCQAGHGGINSSMCIPMVWVSKIKVIKS